MPIKVDLYEMIIIFTNNNDSVVIWQRNDIRRCELLTSSALLRGFAPYTVSYHSFLRQHAKIFGYISAQINIYIHSTRDRRLRATGKFGGVAVFKVRTMWTAGILNLNKIWSAGHFLFIQDSRYFIPESAFYQDHIFNYVIHYIIVTH